MLDLCRLSCPNMFSMFVFGDTAVFRLLFVLYRLPLLCARRYDDGLQCVTGVSA